MCANRLSVMKNWPMCEDADELRDAVFQLLYPDFVAFISQANTPGRGHRTINDWIEHGEIQESSYLLDVACSTGFSSRSICRATRCSAVGIDISPSAISEAERVAK